MTIGEVKSTQVRIENLQVKQFFNEDFVKALEKEIKNIEFQHFCLYVIEKTDEGDSKTGERLSVAHMKPEDAIEKVSMVEAEKPETFDKLMKIISDFII